MGPKHAAPAQRDARGPPSALGDQVTEAHVRGCSPVTRCHITCAFFLSYMADHVQLKVKSYDGHMSTAGSANLNWVSLLNLRVASVGGQALMIEAT